MRREQPMNRLIDNGAAAHLTDTFEHREALPPGVDGTKLGSPTPILTVPRPEHTVIIALSGIAGAAIGIEEG
jgi:hypothetical protein